MVLAGLAVRFILILARVHVKADMTVMHKDVKVPNACLPFDVIPTLYRGWFDAVLQNGERIAPPDGSATAVTFVAPVKIIQSSSGLQITLVMELQDSIHSAEVLKDQYPEKY